ncbi:hypothetical protein [Bdellovibrio bacteriovorus]|uniref:hypothetical protein n=1 Tax=Bdellovibrio TaxID=958 RepID=UPI0035A99B60
MKKLIAVLFTICALGASVSSAYEMTEMNPTTSEETAVLEPFLRNCNSPYVGVTEDCLSNTNHCPPGYDGRANYCCGKDGNFYRCGTICESIYKGGN